MEEQASTRAVAVRLFGLSFCALFLELMVIRWAPSQVRLIAYYANLLLISSFLGLGVGAMLSSSRRRLFAWFPPLLTLNILLLVVIGYATLPQGNGEWRFQAEDNRLPAYLVLVGLFIANSATFIPLGQEIGIQFRRLAVLKAYTWDLGGALCGTFLFGLFSIFFFSPILGLSLVILLTLTLGTWRQRGMALPFHLASLVIILSSNHANAHWSAYHFITVHENHGFKSFRNDAGALDIKLLDRPATEPPTDLRTMMNPPFYTVRVNHDFYQLHGAGDPARYSLNHWRREYMTSHFAQYCLPYQLSGTIGRVLVLGAGGGMDVEAALFNGATHVDAVEIDSVVTRISNRFNPSSPYTDPRLTLHIDDARAFLQRTEDHYDQVIFGYLDSQVLFSYGTSLRLDGYTYTVESFAKAWEHVNEGGMLAVSFFAGKPWMANKLIQMAETATGTTPLIYGLGAKIIIVTMKSAPARYVPEFHEWRPLRLKRAQMDVATDDWPYLYLEKRAIPRDYAIVIGLLVLVSVAAVTILRGHSVSSSDGHFFFMGWGFLLLQTKSIGDCSLYFGTTYTVTMLVVAGVLLMVLLANGVAGRLLRAFSPWMYAPLLATLLLLVSIPREWILGQPFSFRMAWALLVVTLPFFFAGLIFSTTFREAADPSASFGANLIGATIGGFCEYLSMWMGNQSLSFIVVGAYLASLGCLLLHRSGPRATITHALLPVVQGA